MKLMGPSMLRLNLDERPVCCQVVRPHDAPGSNRPVRLPLLLLHGLGCSSEAWAPTLYCLAQRPTDQPAFAPDMPGCGRSPGPAAALGMEELADWSARLLDALDLKRVHVAGSSLGCQVGLALARRHPERVGGLVLVGPTPGGHKITVPRYLMGLLVDGCRETVRYNTTLLRMYRQMGLRRYLATARLMLCDDPISHASAVAAPTLIVRGEGDAIVPDGAIRELADRLPRGACQTIAGAAHAVQFTHPERFVEVALGFWTHSVGSGLPEGGG